MINTFYENGRQGLYSLSSKMSYYQISCSREFECYNFPVALKSDCQVACQISELLEKFKSSRDLAERRPSAKWIEGLGGVSKTLKCS